ncbi:MAG: hypothetical protein IAG13_34215 [Deltaproteobacteria bacterium]|nr:hypothetical protein [Nannocystaceae bacterium]
MKTTNFFQAAAVLGVLAFAGCDRDANGGDDDAGCPAGKCDTPTGEAGATCLKREAEVINSSNRGYTPDLIRWACADVEGVTANGHTNDDRGQEYCEYFALVQPPGGAGVDLGRPLDGKGGVTKLAVCAPGETGDECRVTLNDEQLVDLEDNPTNVVGKCVFTSWHADIETPVPACPGGTCPADAAILGFPFTKDNYGMKVSFNSNGAAIDLIEKCFPLAEDKRVAVDWTNPDDPGQQPFYRGCMGTNLLFGTEWRRSDPSICGAINRIAECGCSVPGVTNATELGEALLPRAGTANARRGFRLGTWDNDKGLPGGCRYANTGETGFLVECDITASDLLANRNDPKEFCRAAYGINVVVHVDVPRAAITCEPPDTNEGKTCGEIPWNIGQENVGGGEETGDTDGSDEGSTGDAESGTDGESSSDDGSSGESTGGVDVGNCCTAHDGKGCTNADISACVCAADSFCCDTEWDAMCVASVVSNGCGSCS